MLYVGIIAAIQEHAYDHCRGRVSGHFYIYPIPMGHTLQSFASTEYEFGIRSKREGNSKSGSGKSWNGSNISLLDSDRSKTLPVIYRKVSEEIRSNRFIYGSPKGYGRFWKVPG
jgi:hypothetical protein